MNSDCLQILKLLAEPDSDPHKRKMVTRGANRERQDELHDVVQAQIKKSNEPIEIILKSFLLTENICFQSTRA